MRILPRCSRSALPILAAVVLTVLLAPGGSAVPQEKPGRDKDPTVQQRRQQLAVKQLDMIESELLDVQAQIRKARIDMLMAKAMEQDKNAAPPVDTTEIDETLRTDPIVQALRQEAAQQDAIIAVVKERSPNPERETQYRKAMATLEVIRRQMAQRREVLVAQLQQDRRGDLPAQQRAAQQRINQLRRVEEMLMAEWESRLKAIAERN
jgi:hypothetical protein